MDRVWRRESDLPVGQFAVPCAAMDLPLGESLLDHPIMSARACTCARKRDGHADAHMKCVVHVFISLALLLSQYRLGMVRSAEIDLEFWRIEKSPTGCNSLYEAKCDENIDHLLWLFFQPGEFLIDRFRIPLSAFLQNGCVWLIGSSTQSASFDLRLIVIVVLKQLVLPSSTATTS